MTRETIAKIVKASGVSAGELILIHFWGKNADKTVADQFAAAVAALGASPVVLQQARSVNREIFAGAKESCFDDRYFGLFSKFDAVLTYSPVSRSCSDTSWRMRRWSCTADISRSCLKSL